MKCKDLIRMLLETKPDNDVYIVDRRKRACREYLYHNGSNETLVFITPSITTDSVEIEIIER